MAAQITPDVVVKVLKHSGSNYNPSVLQMQFFESWAETVIANGDRMELLVATDFSFMEVRATGASSTMISKICRFVKDSKIPEKGTQEMEAAQKEINASNVTAWCTIGLDQPKIDAGYILQAPVAWDVLDFLLPNLLERDALREHAARDNQSCVGFGSSIFPDEPEKRLCFDLTGATGKDSRKCLPSAFYFFKTLGFAKPKDSVVQNFSKCNARGLIVNVSLGPKGLVRLSMTATQPQEDFGAQLANGLGFQFNADVMDKVSQLVKAGPSAIEYVANAKGYAAVASWS